MSGCHTRSQCTCKCHVSQSTHCESCENKWQKENVRATGEILFDTEPQYKQETITIKKALWDEMLSYKNKTDLLLTRLHKLETHKNYQIDENRKEARLIEELQGQVSELCDKIAAIGNYCYAEKNEIQVQCPKCVWSRNINLTKEHQK